MTLLALTSLLAALITVSICISILVRSRRSRLQTQFAYLNANLAVCLIITFLLSLGDKVGPWTSRLFFISIIGLPITGLHFFSMFLTDLEKAIGRLLRTCYPLSVIFAGLSVTPLYSSLITQFIAAFYVSVSFLISSIHR